MDMTDNAPLWRRAHAYLEAHPGQALAVGVGLAGLAIWVASLRRRLALDDPYADPLGIGYPPVVPAEAFGPQAVEEAA